MGQGPIPLHIGHNYNNASTPRVQRLEKNIALSLPSSDAGCFLGRGKRAVRVVFSASVAEYAQTVVKQTGIKKIKEGLEKNLTDIKFDELSKTKGGALVLTGTGNAKKAGVDVDFAAGVFDAGSGQLAGAAFVVDSKIEDHYKETVRGICERGRSRQGNQDLGAQIADERAGPAVAVLGIYSEDAAARVAAPGSSPRLKLVLRDRSSASIAKNPRTIEATEAFLGYSPLQHLPLARILLGPVQEGALDIVDECFANRTRSWVRTRRSSVACRARSVPPNNRSETRSTRLPATQRTTVRARQTATPRQPTTIPSALASEIDCRIDFLLPRFRNLAAQ